uniref:Uncharacterized protein n=1 Tax=Panagrolaimus sp. ES5 TaxID=591445 RepID=A0AC34FP55_9BILA
MKLCKPDGSCPKLRERFLKFTLFDDGIKIMRHDIRQDGTAAIYNEKEFECLEYENPELLDKIDGLLVEIDCKTTHVKKILVKCIQ